MQRLLWVGCGGFVGAILRYLVSGWVQRWTRAITFPYGTLAVNMAGCLLIGLVSQLVESRSIFSPETRAFVLVGLFGAFTTFSTFGSETLNLIRDGRTWFALANVTVHVVLGLGMVWLGRILAQVIWR